MKLPLTAASRTSLFFAATLVVALLMSDDSYGQVPPIARPAQGTPESAGDSGRPPTDIEAQRNEIWNSREMLEARAYLDTYFKRSARISDAQAKKYMEDLRSKSPEQMQIWLIKFHEERSTVRRRNESARQGRQLAISGRQSSPSVGGFRNPYAGRRGASSGLPVGSSFQRLGSQGSSLAQRPSVQKPFTGPEYDRARRPLVSGEDVARFEILRGLGPFGPGI